MRDQKELKSMSEGGVAFPSLAAFLFLLPALSLAHLLPRSLSNPAPVFLTQAHPPALSPSGVCPSLLSSLLLLLLLSRSFYAPPSPSRGLTICSLSGR